MEISKLRQYNQGVGKYKVLSSNAGVGSVIPTKSGGFIMPMTTSSWRFISALSEKIRRDPGIEVNDALADEVGAELVEDPRFVSFLRDSESLTGLRCLAAIPHAELDIWNQCRVTDHPVNKRYKDIHPGSNGLQEEMFTIPAVTFPRWFFSRRLSHDLKPVEEWFEIWKRKGCNGGKAEFFAPPRDPQSPSGRRHPEGSGLREGQNQVYNLLEQVQMVLICQNGHISDVPWDKYFCAKLNNENIYAEGFDLFGYDVSSCPCPKGGKHELQWHENRAHSESIGTIKCGKCGRWVSLEGIMNIQPACPGHRPWEGIGSYDRIPCGNKGKPTNMRWVPVISNSVYYAEIFSSLFLPSCYLDPAQSLTDKQARILKLLKDRWFPNHQKSHPGESKTDYVSSMGIQGFIDKAGDSDIDVLEEEMRQVVDAFLGASKPSASGDFREDYRFTEFSVFQNNAKASSLSDKLAFEDIRLPQDLTPYFSKIQQVETLAVSSTQINFSRVQKRQPEIIDGVTKYPSGMKIFKESPQDVLVLPVNQTLGEGLFFSFSEEAVKEWLAAHSMTFQRRYPRDFKPEPIYQSLADTMRSGGTERFYLLHTFSHIMMKELEFSCGYPTASLSERLYFSERMCGVLIYTSDGSVGSMGGLVWQGKPDIIGKIIRSALERALDCSSDPICWENNDQLNYAACFSCAMVSETSCEQMNMGLDRRILVDEDFGFFKDLVYGLR